MTRGMQSPAVSKIQTDPSYRLELVDRYEDGATVAELALELGVHKATVARALKRAGCTLRGRGRRRKA